MMSLLNTTDAFYFIFALFLLPFIFYKPFTSLLVLKLFKSVTNFLILIYFLYFPTKLLTKFLKPKFKDLILKISVNF